MGLLDDLQTLNVGDIVIFKASRLDHVNDHGGEVQLNIQDAETVLSADGISEFCLVSVTHNPLPHLLCEYRLLDCVTAALARFSSAYAAGSQIL